MNQLASEWLVLICPLMAGFDLPGDNPYEFDGVDLGVNISLHRKTGVKSLVSEISTGQRAALALSIFLSLNGGVVARAPWILFDDPVAHVDDVNLLSFLDMLRDLALLGNRQVFFATANARIADLFVRKFDCFGPNFKQILLERSMGAIRHI